MSVNKPGIVELSKKVDCRYTLVVETSKRARQLVAGAQPLLGLLTYRRNLEDEEQ